MRRYERVADRLIDDGEAMDGNQSRMIGKDQTEVITRGLIIDQGKDCDHFILVGGHHCSI